MLFAFSSSSSYYAHYHFALYILAALSLSSASLIPHIENMHLTSSFSHTPTGIFLYYYYRAFCFIFLRDGGYRMRERLGMIGMGKIDLET